MKRLTITLVVLTFMLGCAILPKNYIPIGYKLTSSNSNSSCQDLYEDIAKKWGHHKDFKSCYYYNEKLVDEITRRNTCFLNFNREDVKNMFGEPTIVYENKLQYNMSMSCEASDTLIVSPYSLYFKFEEDKVISIQKLKASVIN